MVRYERRKKERENKQRSMRFGLFMHLFQSCIFLKSAATALFRKRDSKFEGSQRILKIK